MHCGHHDISDPSDEVIIRLIMIQEKNGSLTFNFPPLVIFNYYMVRLHWHSRQCKGSGATDSDEFEQVPESAYKSIKTRWNAVRTWDSERRRSKRRILHFDSTGAAVKPVLGHSQIRSSRDSSKWDQ